MHEFWSGNKEIVERFAWLQCKGDTYSNLSFLIKDLFQIWDIANSNYFQDINECYFEIKNQSNRWIWSLLYNQWNQIIISGSADNLIRVEIGYIDVYLKYLFSDLESKNIRTNCIAKRSFGWNYLFGKLEPKFFDFWFWRWNFESFLFNFIVNYKMII